jgi:hypothetical protein
MSEQRVRIPYTPRPGQAELHLQLAAHRWAVLVIHRRWGKTVSLLNELIKQAMITDKENARYAYVAPFLKQAKTLAWDYLKRFTDPIPGRVYSESELKVKLPNGSQIRLFGADNPDAIRGIYLDGAVLDEYAFIDPLIFSSIIRPALSDRKGFCIFSSTPNGRNHFYDLLLQAQQSEDWYWCILKASETGVVEEDELKDARKTMTEEEYNREYECSFESIIGKRIYPEFKFRTHVATTTLFPEVPTTIYRGWDNTGLSPAIVFSYLTSLGQWRVFKEFCFEDCGIMEATESIIIWGNKMLPPGCKFVDHGDPAGRIRDTNKGSARDYITKKAAEFGVDIYIIDGVQTWKVRRESVANRLNRFANGEPGLLIDPDCRTLIEGFDGGYSYRALTNLPGMFAEEAIKNKYSHIHDALQYSATRIFTNHTPGSVYDGGSVWDEDDYNPAMFDEVAGRSIIGGY